MDARAARLLDDLYRRFHHPQYIHPDPLEIVRRARPQDRECAGFIASSFAMGRVDLILTAVDELMRRVPCSPSTLRSIGGAQLRRRLRGFRYRFFGEERVAAFLAGMGAVLTAYGTLEACFRSCLDADDRDFVPAGARFVRLFRDACPGDIGILLSDPAKGSACKRLHLYLRWMIRNDEVDPGGWDLPTRMLVVPVDVHMLRVSRMLGFTTRKVPDLKAAREITAALALLCPEDPTRYDFSMTRLGIHPSLQYADLYGDEPPPVEIFDGMHSNSSTD